MELCRPHGYKNIDVRPSFIYANRNYHVKKYAFTRNYGKNVFGMMCGKSLVGSRYNRTKFVGSFPPTLSNLCVRCDVSPVAISRVLNKQSYPLFFANERDEARDPKVRATSGKIFVSESNWVDKSENLGELNLHAIGIGERARHVSNKLHAIGIGERGVLESLHYMLFQQFLDPRPYIYDVLVPMICISFSSVWLLHGWKTNVLARFLTVRDISTVRREKLLTLDNITCFGLFVLRLMALVEYCGKPNVLACTSTVRYIFGIEREKLLTLDIISSIGLFVLRLMALVQHCGMAMQSTLTVGGIREVAAAFASRAIFGDVLCGLGLHILKPFSIGDTIEVGCFEGEVVEIGLPITTLLIAKKFTIKVPNSMFSCEATLNKSRALNTAVVTKFPLQTKDLRKIHLIAEDIKSMLRSHSLVYSGKKTPLCFVSPSERSYDLIMRCRVKPMVGKEHFLAEEDILIQSIRIIKQHRVKLCSDNLAWYVVGPILTVWRSWKLDYEVPNAGSFKCSPIPGISL